MRIPVQRDPLEWCDRLRCFGRQGKDVFVVAQAFVRVDPAITVPVEAAARHVVLRRQVIERCAVEAYAERQRPAVRGERHIRARLTSPHFLWRRHDGRARFGDAFQSRDLLAQHALDGGCHRVEPACHEAADGVRELQLRSCTGGRDAPRHRSREPRTLQRSQSSLETQHLIRSHEYDPHVLDTTVGQALAEAAAGSCIDGEIPAVTGIRVRGVPPGTYRHERVVHLGDGRADRDLMTDRKPRRRHVGRERE